MTMALTFQTTTFDVVDRNGQPWIRGPQIEAALGFTKIGAVKTLYARHADEFTDSMTAVVKLPTEGGEQAVRIFSLRGCHLLAMLARTKVAKAFRRWVLDVLDKVCQPSGEPQAIPQNTTPSTAESRKPLRALVHAWAQVTGVHHAALWPQVKAHFQLSRIDDLPDEWLPDALAFVQERIDEAAAHQPAALPLSRPLPRPALPQGDGLPPDALDAMTDSQRARRFRRLMEEVRGLAQKVGSTMDMVRFTTHPGARYVRIAPQLDARYNALDQMHKIAVAGLYQAEHMLYCLYFLGEGVEFR